MEIQRLFGFIFCLLICVLLSGCVEQSVSSNVQNESITSITITKDFTLSQTQTPIKIYIEKWIKIDPINAHYIGEEFKIAGTTNFGTNEILFIDIWGPSPIGTRNPPKQHEINGILKIFSQDYEWNNWSFLVNTSQFSAGYYYIQVYSENSSIVMGEGFSVTGKFIENRSKEK